MLARNVPSLRPSDNDDNDNDNDSYDNDEWGAG